MYLLVEKRFNCFVFFSCDSSHRVVFSFRLSRQAKWALPSQRDSRQIGGEGKGEGGVLRTFKFCFIFSFSFCRKFASTFLLLFTKMDCVGCVYCKDRFGPVYWHWHGRLLPSPMKRAKKGDWRRPMVVQVLALECLAKPKTMACCWWPTSLGTRQVAFQYNATMPCWTV